MILNLRNIKSSKLTSFLSSFPFTNRTINSLSKCSNGITARLLNRSLSAKVLNGNVPTDTVCPRCGAPHQYLYDNNGGNGQFKCAVCSQTFKTGEQVTSPLVFKCPYCGRTLSPIKNRKSFTVYKCINDSCLYYLSNKKKLPKDLKDEDKYLYKLHYIYREFKLDFFRMDLHSLPKNATSFNFRKFNPHILGLVLTYHVNLQLSTLQNCSCPKGNIRYHDLS